MIILLLVLLYLVSGSYRLDIVDIQTRSEANRNHSPEFNYDIADKQVEDLIPALIGCTTSLDHIERKTLKVWPKRYLDPTFKLLADYPTYKLYRAQFNSRVETLRVFANIAIPKGTEHPPPLVIFFHGLASDPDRVFNLPTSDYTQGIGDRLAKRGLVVIAPYIYNNYRWNVLADTFYPVMELNVAAGMASIDLAEALHISSSKIASYGVSLGGRVSRLVSAHDSRIDMTIVNGIHPDPTQFALDRGFTAKGINQLSFFGDSPCSSEALGSYLAIYPRPIILENGKSDYQVFRLSYLIERLLEEEPSIDIKLILHEGGHTIDPEDRTIEAILSKLK